MDKTTLMYGSLLHDIGKIIYRVMIMHLQEERIQS